PCLADYLADVPEAERPALLAELIALDIAYRRQAGEDPAREDYREHLASSDPQPLIQTIDLPPAPTVAQGERPPAQPAAPGGPVGAAPPPAQRFRCPHCHNPLQLAGDQSDEVLCPGCGGSFRLRETRATTTASRMRPLGKFQLLERVGLGAFGAVW